MELTTPVLFLVFNRPDKTQMVWDIIRQTKPHKLYVSADAPRLGNENDQSKCACVRAIVENVDWDCETHYLFHEDNLGCSLAGKTAWDWFFNYEDRMIFIEDDGLATPSFFYYCQELLERYKDDEEIAYIGGVNYQVSHGGASYFFSHLSVPTYGMATWKRIYDLYEYELESYPRIRNTNEFRSRFVNKFERDWFIASYDQYYDSVQKINKENTYDKQMSYLIWKYNKLCIHPNKNLIKNIGFDYDGSNTKTNPNSWIAIFFGRPAEVISNIEHPNHIGTTNALEHKMFKAKVLLNRMYIKSLIDFYGLLYYRRFFKSILKKL